MQTVYFLSEKLKISLPEELLEIGMDLQNLLSCIHCHEEGNNIEIIIETLKTIVKICSEEKCGKDAFREVGGIEFLLDFVLNTDQVAILEFSFKVLAFVTDGNVHNQKNLTNHKVFMILKAVLEKNTYPLSLLKNVLIFYSTLLFQNKAAQDFLQDAYIQSLISHYKHYAPLSSTVRQEGREFIEIWLNISRILCFAVNNPLNEKNQDLCSVLLPETLKVIETSSDAQVIEASSSFLSLCISNNAKNQSSFSRHDGFLVLKSSLNKTFELIRSYAKNCNNTVSQSVLRTCSCLVGIISSAILNHEKNALLFGEIGFFPQLIELLSCEVLDSCIRKKIILTLAHSIDACDTNRFLVLDVPYFDLILKKNLQDSDLELQCVAKYLLQVCLKTGLERNVSCLEAGENVFLKSYSDQLEGRSSDQNDAAKLYRRDKVPSSILPEHHRSVTTDSEFHDASCELFSAKNTDKRAIVPKFPLSENNYFDVSKSSSKDSLSETSLFSAGHLYRMRRKVKSIFQSPPEKKSVYSSNFLGNKNTLTQPKTGIYDISASTSGARVNLEEEENNPTSSEKVKKQQGSFESCSVKEFHKRNVNLHWTSQQHPKGKHDIDESDTYQSTYCKQRGETNSVLNSKLVKRNSSRGKDSFQLAEKVLSKTIVSGPPMSVLDTASNQSVVEGTTKKACLESENSQPESLRPPPKSYLCKTLTSKSGKYPPSCVEAVVLPGTKCPIHNLAAHIELFKVCPILNYGKQHKIH